MSALRASRRYRVLAPALALVLLLAGCAEQLAAPAEPLRLLRPSWGEAFAGEAFDGALRPTGGLRPYRFELAAGELPEGLRLEGGRIVGTPTEPGRSRFTIEISDGNLSQALLELELVVRPLPTPVVRVATPATEVRGPLRLVARVEDARGWLGARLVIRWDADRFTLEGAPTAVDGRTVAFAHAEPGVLFLDVAALGAARDGAFDVARWTLVPVDPPARASVLVVATSRYSGGEAVSERREGAPRSATAPPSAATPTTPSDALDPPSDAVDPPSDAVDPPGDAPEGTP
ncbi:MAG: putative Ig domain-containing protein [Trueperaceae bacterium]